MSGRQPHAGEAVIIRAFKWSMMVLVLLVVGALMLWAMEQDAQQPVAVRESGLSGPAAEPDAGSGRQPPAARFLDISRAAGIDFVHVSGAYGERLLPEPIGSGGGFLDYDNDGDADVLLVSGDWWPGHEQGSPQTLRLYRNDGDKRFTDVTRDVGLDVVLYGMGVAFGDFDNDGWRDIYITALGKNLLFHNDGGRFSDVSRIAGVAGLDDEWSTSAAFADIDNDGDLDLFVTNYVQWSRNIDVAIDFRLTGIGRTYGAPDHFNATHNRLYRNDGNGRFTDVSLNSGIMVTDVISGKPVGKGLAVAPVDYDRDGKIDLLVANDTDRNFLYHNLGEGYFEEVGELEGVAYDRDGKATGAMGIDTAWFRNTTDLGIAIGNFANEMSSLFVTSDGKPPFVDEAVIEGFGPASRLVLTFGVLFFDYDLDGRLDLLQANGHLEPEINRVQPSQHHAQPAQLFWNCGDDCPATFVEVRQGGDLATPLVGRGAAYADIDLDGDLDLLITQNGRRAVLLENTQQTGHHWLRMRLRGSTDNRDAIGAIVELTTGQNTQVRQVMSARSYMSQVELPITFGLGESTEVDRLTVVWPNGQRQDIAVADVDTTLTIQQAP